MREIIRNFDDIDAIACLYYAFKACGRIDQVFYSGHDLIYFLELFNKNTNYLCVLDNKPVGFGIINEYAGTWKRCEASFAFLPDCPARQAVEFGKEMLRDLFLSESRLRHVYGTTPSRNKTAIKFAQMIGMKVVAQTPAYLDYHGIEDDAVITYAFRENIIGSREAEGNHSTDRIDG